MSWFNTIFGLLSSRAKTESYVAEEQAIGTAVINEPLNVVGLVSGTGLAGHNNGPILEATYNTPRGIAIDGRENIYIADFNNHVIRRIDAETGLVETFAGTEAFGDADGDLLSCQFNYPIGLCFDNQNNLYVTDAGNKCLRHIDISQGTVTTLFKNSFQYPTDVEVTPMDEIFVVDYGSNKIFNINASGDLKHFAGTGTSSSIDGMRDVASLHGPAGIVYNQNNGNIYITEYLGNCIRMIDDEGLVSTFSGSPGEPGHVDGVGRNAKFTKPFHIDSDRNGNLYVADMGNNKVRQIMLETAKVTTLQVKRGDNNLSSPTGICAGWYAIYIGDSGNHMIREIYFNKSAGKKPSNRLEDDPDQMALHGNYKHSRIPTYMVDTLAGSGSYGVQDGKGIEARLGYIRGMALGRDGNVYVCDMYNQIIRKISSDGIVTKVAGSGRLGYKDGPANEAQFMYPTSIAVDGALNLYVCETHGRIRKISNGKVTTVAGQYGWGHRDGPASQARFYYPYGICVSKNGRTLFVADLHNHRIRAISLQDGIVSTFAGIGNGQSQFESGAPRLKARIQYPYGIAIDKNENLYVLENHGTRIVKISNGIATTFAGTGRPGWKDGSSTQAQFSYAQHLSIDDTGYMFVSDYNNNAIRRITPDGIVSTIAKSDFWRHRDGLIKVANFAGIMGAVMDTKKNTLYVADWRNHRIRTIKPTSVELNDLYVQPFIELDASSVEGVFGRTATTIPNSGKLDGEFRCFATRFYTTADGLRYLHMSHHRGNGYIQWNGSITWNSFVRADGTPDGITIFVVAQMFEASHWARFFDFGSAAAFENIVLARNGRSTIAHAVVFNKHAVAGVVDVGNIIDSQWHVYALQVRNGTNMHNIRMFKDTFVNMVSDRTFNKSISNRTTSKNYIGKSNWAWDQTASMNLRQISIYDTALSDTDMQSTMDLLRTKWKI